MDLQDLSKFDPQEFHIGDIVQYVGHSRPYCKEQPYCIECPDWYGFRARVVGFSVNKNVRVVALDPILNVGSWSANNEMSFQPTHLERVQ